MEVTRLFDILDNYLVKYPNQEVALAHKIEGKWRKFGIQEYTQIVNNISYGLLAIGIQPGDKVAIISGSRAEWNMLDFAVMQIGAISIPIYPTISQDDYRYILNHAEMKAIFIDGKELRTKIEPILPEVSTLEYIYTFDDVQCEYPYLQKLIELGEQQPQPETVQKIKDSITPDKLATIIYTSGTTGNPKGVMLSHNNIVQNVKCASVIPSDWNKTVLSFLPLCHAYERMLVYLYQYLGISVYYAESLATIAENIKEVNPTMMSCVPRLLEKIYDKLYLSGKELPLFTKLIYYWAFKLATKYQLENVSMCYKIRHSIADKLVYSKWRKAIGGNFDIVVSGGSAIQPHMSSFFTAIGMPVFEGYGLSETSPVISVHQRLPNGRKAGTVGFPLQGVEVTLGEKDEILCRGHNVMIGYYKDEGLTAQVIDADGWFHTGDTGKITPEGQLIITGRLKSLFKTSFGKYVNPQAVETKMTESPMIENMIVVGENKKFAAAIVLPDFNFVKNWCKKQNISYSKNSEIITNQQLIKAYQHEINKYNKTFGNAEQVKRFKLVADEWTQANGFLSPTLKIKRNVIEKFYEKEIEKLFN